MSTTSEGGGSGWGMDPGGLYQAGGTLSGLEGDADAAGSAFRTAVEGAEGAVVHPKVAGALGDFLTTWSGPSRNLGTNVAAVGSQVQTTATTGTDADADATVPLAGLAMPNPSVSRPINVPY